jgi:signal transduction histidine kinase/DNA-binding CsgD family transcriptional regulator
MARHDQREIAAERPLELLTKAAAAILAAEPGAVARAVHPAVASSFPHEALAVLIGHCAETPVDLWARDRLHGELERASWVEAVASARSGGSARIAGLPVVVHSAGTGDRVADVVVLSRRAPTAAQDAFMASVAKLVAARFEQSRRLATPSTLVAAQAITSERRRVAETLHGRQQAALESVLAALRSPSDAEARAREAERVASEALVELRVAAQFEADFAESAAASLLKCVERELGPMAERAGLRPEFHLEGSAEAVVPETVAQAATYITRSAVVNACEHADGERVRVAWRVEPSGLAITVADDGTGFDGARADGPGLRGMRSRASAVGGELDVETSQGWGTRVRAWLPTTPSASTGDAQAARELIARLGEREREVLALIADGARNRDVASALQLSPHTVKAHLANIMRKLEASTRVEVSRIWTLARFDDAATGASCPVPRTG